MQYMELFPHYCIALLLLVSVKTFQLLFSFFVLKKISQVQQVCWNDPSSITFSSVSLRLEYSIVFAFSRNSSQLARLFKVALSPDLNTVHWFARMDFCSKTTRALVSVYLQWNVNSRCLESGQYRLLCLKVFRVQITVYVENIYFFKGFCKLTLHIYIYFVGICLSYEEHK